ncbi:MAG: alkaline phosphatase [Chitinophagaceae bacterium]
MKKLVKPIFAFVFLLLSITATAQLKTYSVKNAHSHNDYLNSTPFYLAFKTGFGSIEADVFPVNGILYVAHNKKDIQPKNTLKDLYINPLLKEFISNGPRKLSLLIDVKENYPVALSLLIKELEPLQQYFFTLEKPGDLTIILTGSGPAPGDYKNYPDFIFFDDNLKQQHTEDQWRRIALVSLPFYKLSGWKAEAKFKHKDKKVVRHIIDSVHAAGKPIRFWAAPDNELSWKWQMRLRADLIGTDKINELSGFLRKENNN